MGRGALVNSVSVSTWDTAASGNTVMMRDSSGGATVSTLTAATVNVTGNVYEPVVSKTANFTMGTDATCYEVNATSGAITATLPAVAGNSGLTYTVFKTDSSANNVTIATPDSTLINGASTKVLSTQWSSVQLRCDGTQWLAK